MFVCFLKFFVSFSLTIGTKTIVGFEVFKTPKMSDGDHLVCS